jgi:hypothetical protein
MLNRSKLAQQWVVVHGTGYGSRQDSYKVNESVLVSVAR